MLRATLAALALALGSVLVVQSVWAQQASPPGQAQATPTDDDVNQIAKKLFCPVCENVPLNVCPTQACIQWRSTIREKLKAGWTEQQILDYFVAQYGERVLAQPSTRGLNLLVWIFPPVAVAAGAFVLWRFLAQRVAPAPATLGSRPNTPPESEYAARLENELKQRR